MAHVVEDMAAHDNLTKYELTALAAEVGVSDGHPRQRPTAGQSGILKAMPRLFAEAQAAPFEQLERSAQRVFFTSIGQHAAPVDAGRVLSCYSSSCVMDVLSRTLVERFPRVGLIHPTFDNIPDILKRWGLQLVPLDERALVEGEIPAAAGTLDAVFVTTPNNPTGAFLSAEALRSIAERCAHAGMLLALDVCFRGFDRRFQYDTYELLNATGVHYVLIEDTGKLWPTSELKLGFAAYSQSCPLDLVDAMSDVLLSVSPFVLRLVTELALDAGTGGYDELHGLVRRNRERLTTALAGTPATVVDPDSRVSVARVELPCDTSATVVYESLKETDLHVLPCGTFHWAAQDDGERFIRVALGRDPEVIDIVAERLRRFFNGAPPDA